MIGELAGDLVSRLSWTSRVDASVSVSVSHNDLVITIACTTHLVHTAVTGHLIAPHTPPIFPNQVEASTMPATNVSTRAFVVALKATGKDDAGDRVPDRRALPYRQLDLWHGDLTRLRPGNSAFVLL